jgi:hypothetical protein
MSRRDQSIVILGLQGGEVMPGGISIEEDGVTGGFLKVKAAISGPCRFRGISRGVHYG